MVSARVAGGRNRITRAGAGRNGGRHAPDGGLQAVQVDGLGQVFGESGTRASWRSSSEPNPLMAMPGSVRPPPRPWINSRPVPSGSSMSLIRRSNWPSPAAARAAEMRSTGTTL